MKLAPHPRAGEAGSLLPLALFTCLIIGISLSSYLNLASAQHRAATRSQTWNLAIPLAEAGLEEALTQVHLHSANLATNGWTLAPNGLTMSNGVTLAGAQYYRSQSLDSGSYLAAISPGPAPVLTAQGILNAPLSNDKVVRTVRVITAGGALFARGLVARGNIEWSGNILSDSFDSADPLASVNGRYSAAVRLDNGSVGTVDGIFAMGGGIIYGYANTGPTGTLTLGGGTVGDLAWITGGNSGIQPGHFADDLNVSFPSVEPPFTSGYTVPGGGWATNTTYVTNGVAVTSLTYPVSPGGPVSTNQVTSSDYPAGTPYPVTTNVMTQLLSSKVKGKAVLTTTYTTNFTFTQFNYNTNTVTTNITAQYYDHILDNGNYQLSDIPNGEQMLVRGNARLYVTGDINMQGGSQITIANTGTFNLYVGGNVSLKGNGVMNSTGDASRFAIWGLPTCTDVELGGNAEFTGTLYAPQAHLHAGGGGSTNYDIAGAIIVNSIKMNGTFQFHYDENLGRNGPRGAFVVTSWTEL